MESSHQHRVHCHCLSIVQSIHSLYHCVQVSVAACCRADCSRSTVAGGHPPRPAPQVSRPATTNQHQLGSSEAAHTTGYIYYSPERRQHSAVLLSNYSIPLSCCLLLWPILPVLDVSRWRRGASQPRWWRWLARPRCRAQCLPVVSYLDPPRQQPAASSQHSYLGSYHGGGGGEGGHSPPDQGSTQHTGQPMVFM